MKRILIDNGWLFREGPPPSMYLEIERDKKSRKVDLPHDFSIERAPKKECPEGDACGYLESGIGTYMRYFEVAGDMVAGKILLELDGAYCNAEVSVNGHLVGIHPNGYMPWRFDLSRYINAGKNRIGVTVGNMGRNTRWYSGTGIYRHASLRTGGEVHLTPDPVFLRTESISGRNAHILAEVFAENETSRERHVRVRVSLHRDLGRGVPCGEECALGECSVFLPPCGKGIGRVRFAVKDAALWTLETPALYVARVVLSECGEEIDTDEVLFGIRTVSLDTENGLTLNGSPVKLKGSCVHHDHGILGAASFYDAEYRRMKLHKENGFNAIRCAHNPMSAEMMEACDRIGLLVVAEAFDMWDMQKNPNDYHLFFRDWWERDLTAFIERDRNHPCIFCWSIGNEVVERNGLSGGAATCAQLAEKARSLDGTRYITAGIPIPFNGLPDRDVLQSVIEFEKAGSIVQMQNTSTSFWQKIFAEKIADFCAPLDFAGYNYLEMRYEEDLACDPNRIICGTESYNESIADIWKIVERNPRILGDFVWTGWDYLGEVWIGKYQYYDETVPQNGLFPSRAADCACFDILGNERPALAYHRIAWGSRETYIAVHSPEQFGKKLQKSPWAWDGAENSWYFPGLEGQRLNIDIYTSAAEAEVIVNGRSLGKKAAGKERANCMRFETDYVPGRLVAISYDAEGNEISRSMLVTPGTAEKIALVADRVSMPADGQSLAFIEVSVADEEGNVVPVSDRTCEAKVEGPAILAAFGSAAPVTEEVYTSGKFTSYHGKLLAVIRAGLVAGETILTVKGKGLREAKIQIRLEQT